tara:strand:- start:190 stop:1917 length:1728 start_codon:yes stop_codon:yes gene_type:complete
MKSKLKIEHESIESIRNQFPILKKKLKNQKNLIYLDNAATTQKPQRVIDKLITYYTTTNANIHRGIHELAETATLEYENTRKQTANFLNTQPEEIIFTTGTTASINLLARALEPTIQEDDEIIISIMEHHSNFVPWQQLALRKKAKLIILDIDDNGTIPLETLKKQITQKTKILAITHYSNVLGTINPIKEIAHIAHQKNIIVVVDGAQAIPHLTIEERNLKELDIDFYTFSSHKAYGPMGVGILYGKKELLEKLDPPSYGGGMITTVTPEKSAWAEIPTRFEAGTPSVADIIAFGETLSFIQEQNMHHIITHEHNLTQHLIKTLSTIPQIKILGPPPGMQRAPLISFTIENMHPHDIAALLNQEGIATRAGHHCCMPLMNKLNIPACTRISIALYNTEEEIQHLTNTIKNIIQKTTLLSPTRWDHEVMPTTEELSSINPQQIGDGELSEEQEIYKENILDHYRNPHNKQQNPNATIIHQETNPLCGDILTFYITHNNEKITNISFNGEGCAISQAVASMLTQKLTNTTLTQAMNTTKEEILSMLGIPLGPVRMRCALLSLKTLQKGLLEKKNDP